MPITRLLAQTLQLEGDDEDAKKIAKAALPKIKAAVKKFGDEEEQKAATWNAQKRDSDPSYEDLREMLSTAVAAEYAPKDDEYCYVYDFGDDWVVFSKSGEKLRCSYEMEGSAVTLGDAEQVRPVTTYAPMSESKSAREDEPDEEECPTCEGSGKIKEGTTTCPTCKGTGKVTVESKSAPRNPATPKRAFSSWVEQSPPHTIEPQVRMSDDTPTANFLGYAYTIDERYGVTDFLGEYEERIGPGASSKTLREQSSIPLLLNHDGLPMANTSSRTSKLSDDGAGLLNEAEFDRRQGLTNDVCIALERGDIDKMSFSFRATKEEWNDTYDDRYVTELRLYDTSIVTYPANPATSAELVDEMRSALGREGRSLWLAEHELSVRSVLPALGEAKDSDVDDLCRARPPCPGARGRACVPVQGPARPRTDLPGRSGDARATRRQDAVHQERRTPQDGADSPVSGRQAARETCCVARQGVRGRRGRAQRCERKLWRLNRVVW